MAAVRHYLLIAHLAMPKRRYLSLTAEQQAELEQVRDCVQRPYLRERVAAAVRRLRRG